MNTFQEYFSLQFTMLKRHLIEFGINPFLGIVFIVVAFYGFSIYLFSKTEFAQYIYVIAALYIVFQYSEINRNDFLKFVYPKSKYVYIRIAENIISILPFALFLIYKQTFIPLLILIILSMIVAFLSAKKSTAFTIPTPFYKKPFEFVVGFRKSFITLFLAYFLLVMSLINNNFNLGIFSLLFTFLVCLSFYLEPESEFFVWVHNLSVNQFILEKLKIAFLFSTVISMPIAISLLYNFKSESNVIIGFQALGYAYLLTIILAKYASFPNKINLPQGILLALSISLPPVLIVLIPFFYFQSRNRLKDILE